MRVTGTKIIGTILAFLIGLAGVVCPGTAQAQSTLVQLSLDRPLDAAAAPVVVAISNGLFSAERLAVTINIANGSPDAIEKVAAGTSDFALVDINSLVRF